MHHGANLFADIESLVYQTYIHQFHWFAHKPCNINAKGVSSPEVSLTKHRFLEHIRLVMAIYIPRELLAW